ncbi:hypothetical protein Pmani_002627 [Petrolisthes manimaculis]|uniref:Homeobox domain-containing protein n=1 Tax=Petrolisthes manimaculis TaxID=1843537 RepID=A0AAE1QHJ2_9EUCA|nr:hypothetical protein Pmani_002627 [Petrolisthes manimaculis]
MHFPGPEFPTFLLPFRKPKRIRTAFSPSQLLKLEQAFEKNQYVVGAERKQLAQSLNLSETQTFPFFLQHTFPYSTLPSSPSQCLRTPTCLIDGVEGAVGDTI